MKVIEIISISGGYLAPITCFKISWNKSKRKTDHIKTYKGPDYKLTDPEILESKVCYIKAVNDPCSDTGARLEIYHM